MPRTCEQGVFQIPHTVFSWVTTGHCAAEYLGSMQQAEENKNKSITDEETNK